MLLDVCGRRQVVDLLVALWRQAQGDRYLLAPGSWHACASGLCRLVQLRARVTPPPDVTIVTPSSPVPDASFVVESVFVCWSTGKVHVCMGEPSVACGSGTVCALTGRPLAPRAVVAPLSSGTSALSSAIPSLRRSDADPSRTAARVARDMVLRLAFSGRRLKHAQRARVQARQRTRRWVLQHVISRAERGLAPCWGSVVSAHARLTWLARESSAAPFRMPRARRDALASSLGAAVGRLRAACVPCGVATVPVAVFALAVLYLLRVGLWHSATGAQLLPRYDVLGRILPNANQITDYVPDVRARQFTNATRWITVCVSSLGSDVVLRCFDGVSGALVR